jgi:hypothetical protein
MSMPTALPVAGQLLGLALFGGEDDVPAAAFAFHRDRLDVAGHRPVLLDLDLAGADPFRAEPTGLITYDGELSKAAGELGFPVTAPS